MLIGQYTYTLVNGGRLTMPSRFRDDLPEQLIVTKGFDQCVAVYPIQVWQSSRRISALPLTDPKGRELRRMLFSEAMDSSINREDADPR